MFLLVLVVDIPYPQRRVVRTGKEELWIRGMPSSSVDLGNVAFRMLHVLEIDVASDILFSGIRSTIGASRNGLTRYHRRG